MSDVMRLTEVAKRPYVAYPAAPAFLSEAVIDAYEEKWVAVDEANNEIRLARAALCKEADRALRAYATPSSRWPRQFHVNGPRGKTASPTSLRERMAREAESKLQETKRREAAAVQDALTSRAVAYLVARNLVPGQDFTVGEALARALEIAGDERIRELVSKGGVVPFVGQNCDEIDDRQCGGWDMQSHRCECGNRRVDWIVEGTFESPYVYAEAY
ncbi:hypothetical protein [Microcystis phage Mae-JY24]